MGDVRALPGHQIAVPDGTPNADIVNSLEELLAKARAGQIRAFAWCAYRSTDMTAYGWNPGAFGFHLAASVMTLQHAYGEAMYKGEISGDD